MKIFNCHIASPGVFVGHVEIACEKKHEIADDRCMGSRDEITAFEDALIILRDELQRTDMGHDSSDIMEAMVMILEDDSFTDGIRREISSGLCSAESAISRHSERLIHDLEISGSDYLKNRATDVRGISQRLTSILRGNDELHLHEISAVAAAELSPAMLSSLNTELIGAMVSDKGSSNSHAAIIAENMNVPYLYGAGDAIAQMKNDQIVIIDGNEGTIVIEPDRNTYQAAFARMQEWRSSCAEKKSCDETDADTHCKTKICSNIAGPEDISGLIESGADGVGLFRSEFLFLSSTRPPGEEEQFEAYASVLEAMDGKEVIIRTMDIGSDKSVSWLKLPDEVNPALGLRGLRVSLEHPDLFHTQLRALLRASVRGNLKIMFPMISSEWEVDELKEAVRAAGEELNREGMDFRIPELGIMIETPAAVMIADRLAEKVSFFSIGTNDLTQYTLALDRESEGMDRYFDSRHEAVLRLVEYAVESAHAKGISIGICGQLAADRNVMRRFIEAGVDELSVPLSKVKETRRCVAQIESILSHEGDDLPGTGKSCKNSGMDIAAVADGKLVPMNEIPDATFAEGILGPCIGIMPDNGNVYSPCDGTIMTIADTKHAITIERTGGVRYLIHIGIDTVGLKGEGFTLKTKEGRMVKQGELLAYVDLETIKNRGYSPVIVTVKL